MTMRSKEVGSMGGYGGVSSMIGVRRWAEMKEGVQMTAAEIIELLRYPAT